MLLLDFSPIILSRKNVPIKITHTIYIFKIPVLCVHALRACWRSGNTVTSINVTKSIVLIFSVTRVSLS